MRKTEDYALLWANGMPFGDVIRLHARDVAMALWQDHGVGGDEDGFDSVYDEGDDE